MKITVEKAYETKHSVRYNAVGSTENPAVQSMYVMQKPLKDEFGGFPEQLVITIEKGVT
jgi:hypothetical protein